MQPLFPYNIPAYNKQIFSACTQAAQAVSVALATTYTGMCLSNPNASSVNLYLLRVKCALTVAPAGIASLGIVGGNATTDVTHTTPAAVRNTFLNAGITSGPGLKAQGLVDTAATISTPVWLEMMYDGFTAANLPNPSGPIDFDGSWVIPPGGFIAVGALTALTGAFISVCWAELPSSQG